MQDKDIRVGSEANRHAFASWYDPHHRHQRGTAEATSFNEDGEWYLNRVVIQPESLRGSRLGTRLLKALQEKLKTLNCTKLIVEPGGYNSDHDKQVRFYENNGFVKIKENLYEWRPL